MFLRAGDEQPEALDLSEPESSDEAFPLKKTKKVRKVKVVRVKLDLRFGWADKRLRINGRTWLPCYNCWAPFISRSSHYCSTDFELLKKDGKSFPGFVLVGMNSNCLVGYNLN